MSPDQPDSTAACEFCGAAVADEAKHLMWHVLYDLHAPMCAYARTKEAQRHTDMYLYPQGCDCGLARLTDGT